jgi:O-antigen ligase
MQWRRLGMGLLVAGPVLFFPFSRSYYAFYLFILIAALWRMGLPALWRQSPGLRLACYAVVLPMALAILGVGLGSGHFEAEWFEKLAVAAVAALLGLATAGLARDRDTADTAGWLIVIAILSWMLDGLWQLATGASISGHPVVGRLTSYFTHPAKFGFFVSLMGLLPVFFFYRRRRFGIPLAIAALALTGLMAASSGSRFGLLAYLGGVGVFTLIATRQLRRWRRVVLCLGLPALLGASLAGLYATNDPFATRVNQTAQVLQNRDYRTVNEATSGRLDIWYPAVALGRDHWFWGVGPGQVSEAIRPYLGPDNVYRVTNVKIFHTHQVVLEIWLGAGLIGLLGFLAFYAWLCRWLWQHRGQAGLGWACVLVWALAWLPVGTQLGFYASEMMLWSFFMLGLGFGLQTAGPDAGARPAAPA